MDRCSFSNWTGPRDCDICCLVADTETNVEVWRNTGVHMIRHQRCKPDVDEEANQFARSIPGDSSRLSDNFNNPW